MGTNFYFFTKDKRVCEKYFAYSYELTDDPEFGYEIHIAKTSMGWIPLFQAHSGCKSVADMKKIFDTEDVKIVDEYGDYYDWDAFRERVLEFNGGVDGAIPKTVVETDPDSLYHDPNMPGHIPVSHFVYANGKYADTLFKDPEGYEFDTREFA